MTERPNLRIHGVEEGAEIQDNGIGKLFNEIKAENFLNICNNIDTCIQEAFQIPIDMTRKEQSHDTS
jgi:hypothetical protein